MAQTPKATLLSVLRWLLLLSIPALWCVLDHYRVLTFFENKTIDWRFQLRGELESPVKIVYVDIDTVSLNDIGGWPWSRSFFARTSAALINEAKVKAVGYDVVFTDAGLSESVDRRKLIYGNAEFGRYLLKQPPVVLAASYVGQRFLNINKEYQERVLPILATDRRSVSTIEAPEIPSFETSPDRNKPVLITPGVPIGLIDTLDNGTRTVPMWAPNNTKITYYHMAAELARLYWGLPKGSIKVMGDRLDFVRRDGSLQASVPLQGGQMINVNWFTHWESLLVTHHSFNVVYNYVEMLAADDAEQKKAAREFFARPEFRDAIILVGGVDPLFQDLAPTPLDDAPVPKVSVHANLLKTIISGLFLERPSEWTNWGIVFLVAIVVTTLSIAGGARALFAKIIAVLALAVYVGVTFHLFREQHLILPFSAPLGAALTTSFAGLIWQVIDEQKAKSRIKGMFGAYVSPQLVEHMVESGEDPKLGGHEAEITAYFSDIQSFSSFSEILPPDRLVELMNEYLTACTDIVQERGGTLDKYIGDAVVAMYGAPIPLPDHAYRACVATQLVHLKLAELRHKWRSEGGKWPEIVWRMQSRIGLNSGSAVIGNMGSRTRFNYTMMGDNVNLAARMESGAKQYGVYTMIAEATMHACEQHGAGQLTFRYLDKIVVKGRSIPVPIYEVVGLKENVTAQTSECLDVFGQGIARYLAQDWDAAEALFKRSAELEPNQPGKTPGVESNPSLALIRRCHYMREHPPVSGWDGVYVMKEK